MRTMRETELTCRAQTDPTKLFSDLYCLIRIVSRNLKYDKKNLSVLHNYFEGSTKLFSIDL